jgi:hypothetical protein
MPDLLVPSHLAQQEAASTQEINAAMERQSVTDIAEALRWTEELRHIDPSLEVIWVPEQATEYDHPARWHIRKKIPGDVDEWWPLLGPGGCYRAPGMWLLEGPDSLSANDMWNPRVHRTKREARAKFREAKKRAQEREAEQRQDEMAVAYRAAKRIKGDAGLTKRTDLQVPKVIAAERKMQRDAERAGVAPSPSKN